MVIALHIHNRKFWGEEETSLHKTSNELLGSGGFIQIVRLLKLGQTGLDNIPFMNYIPFMEWTILLDEEFERWLLEQVTTVRLSIASHVGLLAKFGPMLGRPQVDTLQGSSLPNLKELRVQIQGDPWRVLFAFDPKRRAIVLVGGNKRGDKRWYQKNIPLAEERYQRHLQRMESATDDKTV